MLKQQKMFCYYKKRKCDCLSRKNIKIKLSCSRSLHKGNAETLHKG